MTGYDFERPFVDATALPQYRATDEEVARRYGKTVRATEMSNSEYASRHSRFGVSNNMKAPPSHGRIFGGYLVIRRLGTKEQYETWMPDHAFNEVYAPLIEE
jgi:hypothetical protein